MADRQYLEHSRRILTGARSKYKPNRTGIDTISLFGYQNEYDLSEGFPILTTKKMKPETVFHELIWFLRGDTNLRYLHENNVHIWDDNAFQYHLQKQGLNKQFKMYSSEWNDKRAEYIENLKNPSFMEENGDLGPVYGKQWTKWKTSDGKVINQVEDLVNMLKKSPSSRRLIVTAWNPEEIPSMALPPCHCLYQLNVVDGKVDLQLYQRSCDMFLGVPFNITSYAALTHILANQADLEPGTFIHTFGDSHFYCGADQRGKFYGDNLNELKDKVSNVREKEGYLEVLDWVNKNAPAESEGKELQDHVTGILLQMSREPKPLPKLEIAKRPYNELTIEDFVLKDYTPHPYIKRAMAV